MTSKNKDLGTLLVHCHDQPGLVSALAQTLYGHGVNILESIQHVDRPAKENESGQFFQRIRFDTQKMHTDRLTLERGLKEVTDRFNMKSKLVYDEKIKRVAVFVSKQEHCLYELLLRKKAGELRCEIPLIISNHEKLAYVAKQFNIPFEYLPINSENRSAVEKKQLELLKKHEIDVAILARYMQILSPRFIEDFAGKIINIHHSFLPAFVGGKPYHQAYKRGVKLIGATAHYVTEDLDEGPIIEQDVIRTSHRDRVAELIRKGRHIEKGVLAQAVRWHLEDRIVVFDNRTVVLA